MAHAVTRVGHAVSVQTPTKPSEITENTPTGFVQHFILESTNAAIPPASQEMTSRHF